MGKKKKGVDFHRIFSTPKQDKAKNYQNVMWYDTVNRVSKHPCPECGEDKCFNILRLRQGFYECRSCGRNYLVDDDEDELEDEY